MDYRRFGNTGIDVSEIGFGCGDVGGLMVRGEPADQVRAVARAMELGINYFDTASRYGDLYNSREFAREQLRLLLLQRDRCSGSLASGQLRCKKRLDGATG